MSCRWRSECAWPSSVPHCACMVGCQLAGSMYFQPAIRVAPAGGSPPRELALGTSVLLAVVVTIGTFVAAQPLLDIATDAVSFLPFPH